jgi:hypothetical protein
MEDIDHAIMQKNHRKIKKPTIAQLIKNYDDKMKQEINQIGMLNNVRFDGCEYSYETYHKQYMKKKVARKNTNDAPSATKDT